jgi:hypothetical protein
MKRILLALFAVALSALSAMAQGGNPFGVNVTGMCCVRVPSNSFALIANPFFAPTNTLACLIPHPPVGSQFFKVRPNGAFIAYTFDEDLRWSPDGEATLNPGEGGMFRNPTGAPLPLMFSGEMPQCGQTNTVPVGTSIYSAFQVGKITTDLGFPAAPGDQVFTWEAGHYVGCRFDEAELKWIPEEPTIKTGQAFLCVKSAPGVWVRKAVSMP